MISGWLSPDGEFYPCKSLKHVETANKLVKEECRNAHPLCKRCCKCTTDNEYNGEHCLTTCNFIKFSEGLGRGHIGFPSILMYLANKYNKKFHYITKEQYNWIIDHVKELSANQLKDFNNALSVEAD